jgi:hypothetical protein
MESTTTMLTYSIPVLREIISLARSNDVEPKVFLEFLKEHDNTSVDKIRISTQDHNVDLCDIINDVDVLERDGFYYDVETYVISDDTDIVLHTNDAYYCERNDVWIEQETVEVWVTRRVSERWSVDAARYNAYKYDGDWYVNLEDFDLVIMCDGCIEHIDNAYYWENDGEYHYEEEEEVIEYTRDYHSGRLHEVNFTDDPKFYVGFEIEKEDSNVKESIFIDEFEDVCPSWKKERDGSLDDQSGYELISPKFELIPDKIHEHIMSNKTIVAHINASISKSCGGHINLSEAGKTGDELFDELKGYTPLFYALYYKRVDKTYCKGKNNNDLKESNEKYQAIKIHSNRIEYRIVSAVPNVTTLHWRARLIEFIVTHKTSCVKEAFFNANTSPLRELLMEMYPKDKYNVLMDRLIKFSLKFENINVNENNN